MEFKYAHLADYAGEGAHGKLIMVGVFDRVFANADRPIAMPRMFLVAVFEAHVTEGSSHQLEIRFTDEDGTDIIPRAQLPIRFVPQGPNSPLRANVLADLNGFLVPDVGIYAFHMFINGSEMAHVPLDVAPIPGTTAR